MQLTVLDGVVHIFKDTQGIFRRKFLFHQFLEKTACIPSMAGRPYLGHFGKQCVLVAVYRQRFHILVMPGGFPLNPKFLPAPAVISHFPQRQGGMERLLVHICHHQHFRCPVVLDNDWEQPLGVQLKFSPLHSGLKFLGFNPFCRKGLF